jgi:hypothetical protein
MEPNIEIWQPLLTFFLWLLVIETLKNHFIFKIFICNFFFGKIMPIKLVAV